MEFNFLLSEPQTVVAVYRYNSFVSAFRYGRIHWWWPHKALIKMFKISYSILLLLWLWQYNKTTNNKQMVLNSLVESQFTILLRPLYDVSYMRQADRWQHNPTHSHCLYISPSGSRLLRVAYLNLYMNKKKSLRSTLGPPVIKSIETM